MTFSTPDTSTEQSERSVPVDVEHTGIRLAIPVLAALGLAAGYGITAWLTSAMNLDAAGGCLPVLVGIVVAVLVAVVADRYLKRLWPSGRSLVVNSTGLQLRDQRKNRHQETRISWDQRVNILAWRFAVERGSARVPKGWNMLAMKLLQDEAEFVFYAFMPPKEASALPAYSTFTLLTSRSAIEKGDLSLREASEQRRLLKAEDERWQDGAEVRREDFGALVASIMQHIQHP